jgi:glycosyltransferase involved in cell wall biosynthesis
VRVAIVSHYFEPHTGGVETVVKAHAQWLIEHGSEVLVVTSRLEGDADTETRDGVAVRRVRALNTLETKLGVPVPLVGGELERVIEEFNPDVVIAHGHAYITSWRASRAAKRLRVPFVVVQHNPFVEYPLILEAVERIVDASLGRRVLMSADVVVCVSRHVAAYIHAIAPRAVTTVVHNGVDVSRFSPCVTERSAPGAAERVLRVGTLRRLVPRQGVDVLITAWREAGLGAGAELVIGGGGPEQRRLEDLASGDESITFLGRVDDDDLVEFYQSCDVFVLPTTSGEGFGLVAAEALACGVPVVTTDEGGAREVVRDGIDGVHVRAKDTESVSQGIQRLLRDNDERIRMAEAARERTLSWEERCQELLEVLLYVKR